MTKDNRRKPPEVCPVCGAEVPRSALACPECGADDETGWNEAVAVYDGIDLPDEEFNYDEYVKKEFGGTEKTGNKKKTWIWLWIVGVVFVLVNIVLVIRGLMHPSFRIIRITYNFNTVVAPCVFLAFALIGFIVHYKRRSESPLFRAAMTYLCIGVVLVCVRIYATHIEPRHLVLREVRFSSPHVKQPIRILHISDIQSDRIGRYEREVFRRMQDLHADIIVHTGDLLQPLPPASFGSELPKLAALFRGLSPPLGIYGVYGDVDEALRRVPADALGGLRLLENAKTRIQYGNTTIEVFGLANYSSRSPEEAKQLIRNWLNTSGPNNLTLLLGHSPDFAVAAQDFPLDLCLAGHTHGGQIRIPIIGPLLTLTKYIPRSWSIGYRKIGKTRLNVSAGIGSEHQSRLPSIRLNCPPEMTLIVIEPDESGSEKGKPTGAAN